MKKLLFIIILIFIFSGCSQSNSITETIEHNTKLCISIDTCHTIDLSAISNDIEIRDLLKTKNNYVLLAVENSSLIVIFLTKSNTTDRWIYKTHQTYSNLIDDSSVLSITSENIITIFIGNNSNTTTLNYELTGDFIERNDSTLSNEKNNHSTHIKQVIPLSNSFLALSSITDESFSYLTKYSIENEIVWSIPIEIEALNGKTYNSIIQLINDTTFLVITHEQVDSNNQSTGLEKENIHYAIHDTNGNLKKNGYIPVDSLNLVDIIPSSTPSNIINIQSNNQIFEFDPITDTFLDEYNFDNNSEFLQLSNNHISIYSELSNIVITQSNRNEVKNNNYDFIDINSPQLFYSNEQLVKLLSNGNTFFMISDRFVSSKKESYDPSNNILKLEGLEINCKMNEVCQTLIKKEIYNFIDLSSDDLLDNFSIEEVIKLNNGKFLMVISTNGDDSNYLGTDCGCPSDITVILFDNDWNYIRHDYYPNMAEFYRPFQIYQLDDYIYLFGSTQFQDLTVSYDLNGEIVNQEILPVPVFEEQLYGYSTDILSYKTSNYAILTANFKGGDVERYSYFFAKMDKDFTIVLLRELDELYPESVPYVSYIRPINITLSENNTLDVIMSNDILYSYDLNGNLLNQQNVDSSSIISKNQPSYPKTMYVLRIDDYFLIIDFDKLY